jgi:DNA mismatch repair protein MutH
MINIKVDTNEFEKRINSVKKDIPKIAKKMMALVFQKMRADIKTNIRSNFTRRKGWLLSGLNYYAFDDFSGSIFTRNNKKQGVKYASVLEEGTTITAKKGKYLFIRSGKDANGKTMFKKVPSVTIPPRPFFKPVVNDYWDGGGLKASNIMDKGLQKEIEKYVEKHGGGLIIRETED